MLRRPMTLARPDACKPALWLDLPDGAPRMAFQYIPAKGKVLRMGSREAPFDQEEPVHEVLLGHDFYLGTVPVTQAQFDPFKGTLPEEQRSDYSFSGPMNPAEDPGCGRPCGFESVESSPRASARGAGRTTIQSDEHPFRSPHHE